MIARREALAGGFLVALAGAAGATTVDVAPRYARVGLIRAKAGLRAELLAILREGTGAMPGCFAYFVNEEAQTDTGIWITEVWDGKASHAASLSLPTVRDAIRRGRPMIAGFDVAFEASR